MNYTACEIGRTPRWNESTSSVDTIVYVTLRKPGGTTDKKKVRDHLGKEMVIGGNPLPDEIITIKIKLEDYLEIVGPGGLPEMGGNGACSNAIKPPMAAKLEAASTTIQ